MIKGLGILILMWGTAVFAQEDIKLSDPFLSLKYTRGAYLLHDCVDGHWVCTSRFEYNSCVKTREYELLENFDKLSCVPSKEFETEKDCVASQKALVSNGFGVRYCVNSGLRSATKLKD